MMAAFYFAVVESLADELGYIEAHLDKLNAIVGVPCTGLEARETDDGPCTGRESDAHWDLSRIMAYEAHGWVCNR